MSYGNRGGGYGGGYGRGGGRGFGGGGPKPVERGKEYEVQISETSRQGDGIARVQGFVIFVKEGKVGEKTKIRITNVGERFATAEKVSGSATESVTPAKKEDSEAKQAPVGASEEEKPSS